MLLFDSCNNTVNNRHIKPFNFIFNIFKQVIKMIYSIEQIKERVEPIAKKYGITSVYLFGSYAKGLATDESDVDLLIDKTGSTLKGLFAMGGLYNDLQNAIGKQIDIITTGALEDKGTHDRTPWLVENLNNEKVKIYE
jgi:predicted nucleotidyltransferase